MSSLFHLGITFQFFPFVWGLDCGLVDFDGVTGLHLEIGPFKLVLT